MQQAAQDDDVGIGDWVQSQVLEILEWAVVISEREAILKETIQRQEEERRERVTVPTPLVRSIYCLRWPGGTRETGEREVSPGRKGAVRAGGTGATGSGGT